jgi:multiple sugar transport system substrate-binding protein
MRKLVYFSFILLFSLVLGSCGPKDEKKANIILTFASWKLGEEKSQERRLIKAFEDQYPDIQVEIIEQPNDQMVLSDGWDLFLHDLIHEGKLPDVFMTLDNHLAKHDVFYDLTEMATKDKEYKLVNQDLADAGMVDEKVVMVPQAAHYQGFLINQDQFEANSVPEFGMEWTDFISATKLAAQHEPGGAGVVGFQGVEEIMNWYPTQINPELGWLTYNGKAFHLNDPAFKAAVEIQQKLIKSPSYVFEALSLEQSAEFFGTGDMWALGRQAVKFSDTEDLSTYLMRQANGDMEDFNLAFIGTPKVNETQKIPVKVDWLAVSQATEHPKEAYLLAKWMGFGKVGYANRLDLATNASPVTVAPLQANEALIAAFFIQLGTVPGYEAVVRHDSFVVETIPNIEDAAQVENSNSSSHFHEMLDKFMNGEKSITQLTDFNRLANEMLAELDDLCLE